MKTDISFLQETLDKLIGQKITNVQLGIGSHFSINFGKIRIETIKTKNGTKEVKSGEWFFWIQMAYWEFFQNDELLLDCEDNRESMSEFFKSLIGKSWTGYEIYEEDHEVILSFENDIDLVISHETDDNDDQWSLVTPNRTSFSLRSDMTINFLQEN